jgi:hypothetical protein
MDATNLRFSELRSGVSELSTLVGSFDTLLSGYDGLIAAGESIQTARERFDAGQYAQVRSSLSDAETQADEGQTAFREGREDAPERLEGRFETGVCQSAHFVSAIDLLDEAARAEASGEDGSTQRQGAEDELDAIGDC